MDFSVNFFPTVSSGLLENMSAGSNADNDGSDWMGLHGCLGTWTRAISPTEMVFCISILTFVLCSKGIIQMEYWRR